MSGRLSHARHGTSTVPRLPLVPHRLHTVMTHIHKQVPKLPARNKGTSRRNTILLEQVLLRAHARKDIRRHNTENSRNRRHEQTEQRKLTITSRTTQTINPAVASNARRV